MLDTRKYRSALLARLQHLDRRLHAIELDLETPKSRDWDEAAIEREGDEVLEHLGLQGETEVARIRAALERLRQGKYGSCVSCDEPISSERLDILPETPFCGTCAAQHS